MANSGEEHARAQLTWEDVRFIRSHPELNNAELARQFRVDRSTIRLVRANATWRDPDYVPQPSQFQGTGLKRGAQGE